MSTLRNAHRHPWFAVVGLLALSVVLTATLPSLLAYAAMWGACRLDCRSLGWLAIAYAPALGYITTSTAVAMLGMRSYRMASKLAAGSNQSLHRLQILYAIGAAAALIAMTGIAYLPLPSRLLGGLINHIALNS